MGVNLDRDQVFKKRFIRRCKTKLPMLKLFHAKHVAELNRETVINEIRLGFSEADARAIVELVPELDGAVD
jgi:hypothetical protein